MISGIKTTPKIRPTCNKSWYSMATSLKTWFYVNYYTQMWRYFIPCFRI